MSLSNRLFARAAVGIATILLIGGTAMAEPIVVLNDGAQRDLIISRGEHRISIFANDLTIDPWPTPGGDAPYSLRINFQYQFGNPEVITGSIQGNDLPFFPPMPLQTPALAVPGGLRLEGILLDEGTGYVRPGYDPDSGITDGAALNHGTGPFSAFNLESFENVGDMAYIGYTSSDITIFGYMQIERVTDIDWKLVGYSFDPTGAGILVQNLVVPNGATLLTLGLGGASGLLRKRR